MKPSACLVGAAMLLLTAPQSAAGTTTPKPKLKTKTVSLRSTIVPTWSDVAPYGALTVKLARVSTYWNDLEDNDKDMFDDLVLTLSDRKDAKSDIKAFYDDATECLTVNSLTKGMTPEAFKTKMSEVSTCLKSAKVPAFEILESAKVTPAASTYKPAKHIDTDDYDDGVDDTVTKLKTKTVTLRRTIVPSWDDLAPIGATTIKLARVQQYWDDLEANDVDLFNDYFKTKTDRKNAANKIRTFYDEATECLKLNNVLTKSYNERTINTKLDAVHKCLKQTDAPTFVVASSVKATGAKSTYNPAKHIDTADYPKTTAPTPKPVTAVPTAKPVTTAALTAKPSVAPIAAPVTSAPMTTSTPATVPMGTPAPAATAVPSGSSTPSPAQPISDMVDWPSTGGNDEPKTTEVRDFTMPPATTELPGGNTDLPVYTPAPVSTVAVSGTVTNPVSVSVDEPKTTEVRDATIPPATTEAPSVAIDVPIYTPAPTQASIDVLAHLDPATASAPIFQVLDLNDDGLVSPQEMVTYTSRLSAKAHIKARKAGDKYGLALLQKVIDYHYKSLEDCATTRITRVRLALVPIALVA